MRIDIRAQRKQGWLSERTIERRSAPSDSSRQFAFVPRIVDIYIYIYKKTKRKNNRKICREKKNYNMSFVSEYMHLMTKKKKRKQARKGNCISESIFRSLLYPHGFTPTLFHSAVEFCHN